MQPQKSKVNVAVGKKGYWEQNKTRISKFYTILYFSFLFFSKQKFITYSHQITIFLSALSGTISYTVNFMS